MSGLAAVFEMYDSMNATLTAKERKLHPEADELEIFLRVATWRSGSDLERKVYGWAKDESRP